MGSLISCLKPQEEVSKMASSTVSSSNSDVVVRNGLAIPTIIISAATGERSIMDVHSSQKTPPRRPIKKNRRSSKNLKNKLASKSELMRQFFTVREFDPLPTDILDRDRTEIEHLINKAAFGKLFHLPVAEILINGGKVLDVGCGSGLWASEVATTFPNSKVYGLDMDPALFEGIEPPPNMSFVTGNVLDGLSYPDNTFDAIYQRNLIASIPKDKWDKVIVELVRILKPGGYLELVEIVPETYKRGPKFTDLQDAILRSLKAQEIDMEIGLNLTEKIEEAGLESTQEATCSYPIGWGGQIGELQEINFRFDVKRLKAFLVKSLKKSIEDFDKFVEDSMKECEDNEAYNNCHSVVGRKPS
ncbi:hypothetical protein HK096_006930 [Nowakowskiella sp. JEL0078]|nr:hypothetical protein HK096_006930 [Nowakowskiella sp. JEL0078]